MRLYTVKQLAELAKVSVRTLHYYDEIGLLKPAFIRQNGYRCYGRDELLRLQQILLYRELDMPLGNIGAILDRSGFDMTAALEAHKTRLEQKRAHYSQLIGVISTTLAQIKGAQTMNDETLFNWTSESKQAEYEAWLIERYGEEAHDWIDTSRKHIAKLTDVDRKQAMERMEAIGGDLARAYQTGIAPDSPVILPVLTRHNEWVAYMWGRPCSPEAYSGLAELYQTTPEFSAYFEAMAPGFTEFLVTAMKSWAANR